jgi:hypothetical protein
VVAIQSVAIARILRSHACVGRLHQFPSFDLNIETDANDVTRGGGAKFAVSRKVLSAVSAETFMP